jgi:hypothetical protein
MLSHEIREKKSLCCLCLAWCVCWNTVFGQEGAGWKPDGVKEVRHEAATTAATTATTAKSSVTTTRKKSLRRQRKRKVQKIHQRVKIRKRYSKKA